MSNFLSGDTGNKLALLFSALGSYGQPQLMGNTLNLLNAFGQMDKERNREYLAEQAAKTATTPQFKTTPGATVSQQLFGNATTETPQADRNLLAGNLALRANPEAASNLLVQKAFGPKPAPIISKPGDVGRDPITNAILFSNPEKGPDTPADKIGLAKNDPRYAAYNEWYAKNEQDTAAAKINELKSAAAKNYNEASTPKGPQPVTVEGQLRGEFDQKTKDFVTIRDAYGKITETARNPSPAGDISLIFSYMKLLDPGSTVREGEYATAQNAASVPEQIRAKFNKALQGETLTPSQRADFVKQAGTLFGSQLKTYQQDEERYKQLAQNYGVSPGNVTYDRSNGMRPVQTSVPKPGDVQDGYTFIGGDPADPKSWKKVGK